MEVHGTFDFDDDHDDAANAVSWELTENTAQKNGIFRQFRAAIVFLSPPGQLVWMKVVVDPRVNFSVDPRHLLKKESLLLRLLQRNDHPILLDGKTSLSPSDLGCNGFSVAEFPWEKVLQLPVEYAVSHPLLENQISDSRISINLRTNYCSRVTLK